MPALKRTVSLGIEEAYTKVKDILTAKGCKVVNEEPLKQIKLLQGSLWGITPKTAKKTLTINFEPQGSQTRLTASSKLASDWKNITAIGCILAVVLIILCTWMATDLTAFKVTHEHSFWSWIAAVEGNVNLQATQSFVNLALGLAVFLSAIVLLEAVIVGYAHNKINALVEEVFNRLEKITPLSQA